MSKEIRTGYRDYFENQNTSSTIIVEVTENDYENNFSDLIHRGESFEWCFPTLEDKSHYINIRFVPEKEEL